MSARALVSLGIVCAALLGVGSCSSSAPATTETELKAGMKDLAAAATDLAKAQAARNAPWSGEVVVTRTASAKCVEYPPNAEAELRHSLWQKATITSTNATRGDATANSEYRRELKAITNENTESATTRVEAEEMEKGTGSGQAASVKVEMYADEGIYELSFGAPGVKAEFKETVRTTINCRIGYRGCLSETRVRENSELRDTLGLVGSVEGRIVAGQPNVLSGSHSEPFGYECGNEGMQTVAWKLTR
jgi:hypothetical protein